MLLQRIFQHFALCSSNRPAPPGPAFPPHACIRTPPHWQHSPPGGLHWLPPRVRGAQSGRPSAENLPRCQGARLPPLRPCAPVRWPQSHRSLAGDHRQLVMPPGTFKAFGTQHREAPDEARRSALAGPPRAYVLTQPRDPRHLPDAPLPPAPVQSRPLRAGTRSAPIVLCICSMQHSLAFVMALVAHLTDRMIVATYAYCSGEPPHWPIHLLVYSNVACD